MLEREHNQFMAITNDKSALSMSIQTEETADSLKFTAGVSNAKFSLGQNKNDTQLTITIMRLLQDQSRQSNMSEQNMKAASWLNPRIIHRVLKAADKNETQKKIKAHIVAYHEFERKYFDTPEGENFLMLVRAQAELEVPDSNVWQDIVDDNVNLISPAAEEEETRIVKPEVVVVDVNEVDDEPTLDATHEEHNEHHANTAESLSMSKRLVKLPHSLRGLKPGMEPNTDFLNREKGSRRRTSTASTANLHTSRGSMILI